MKIVLNQQNPSTCENRGKRCKAFAAVPKRPRIPAPGKPRPGRSYIGGSEPENPRFSKDSAVPKKIPPERLQDQPSRS